MYLLLLLGFITLIAIFTRNVYTYWQRKGFPCYNPSILFGCLYSPRKDERSFVMLIYNVYNASSEKFVGIYLMFRPVILIRDAELVRDILVQNFNNFHHRGLYVDEVNDPFSGNLFTLPGPKWKPLRARLAPFFTPGKLRAMFPIMENVAVRMIAHLDGVFSSRNQGVVKIELKSLFSKYVADIIASAVFGLEIDSFKEPNNEFQKITEQFKNPSIFNTMRNTALMLCPKFEKLLVLLGIKHKHAEFMTEMVRQTVEYREKNNIVRRDIMQMLIQLRNAGVVNDDDNSWDINTSSSLKENPKSMSIESIASQAFLFYVAGYETSATAAAYTILEFAKNPSVLEKVKIDIENNLDNGKLTYESIQNMKYLDLCFSETVRKYPVLPILNRQCTNDYKIPGTDKTIEKGTLIFISLLGMHRDPKYFPDPLKYDPDRFLESNQNYDVKAYMPFGEGPRHCIAQQMGKIIVKAAVIHILRNYSLEAVEASEVKFDALTLSLMPKDGINVKLLKKLL